jgi:hypothetical protein
MRQLRDYADKLAGRIHGPDRKALINISDMIEVRTLSVARGQC